MKNHCENCNIDIEEQKSNCALCGKCINEDAIKSGVKSNGEYPVYNVKYSHAESVYSIIGKLLALGTALTMIANLMFSGTLSYSLIVLVSVYFLWVMIIVPFKNHLGMAQILSRLAFFTPLLIMAIELFTFSWGWGLCIVIPCFWGALLLVSCILMVCKGYGDYNMLNPILTIFIMNGALLIFLLGFHQATSANMILLLVNICVLGIIFLFKSKLSLNALKKNYRI